MGYPLGVVSEGAETGSDDGESSDVVGVARSSTLQIVDELIAGRASGGVLVEGASPALVNVLAHARRRAQLAGRPYLIVDGRVSLEPWRDLLLAASIDPTSEPRTLLRALFELMPTMVLGVLSHRRSAWGDELVETLTEALGGRPRRPQGRSLILLHAAHGSEGKLTELEVSAVPSRVDREHFIGALVETSKTRLQHCRDFEAIERAWATHDVRRDRTPGLGVAATNLLRCLVSSRVALPHEAVEAGILGPRGASAALAELAEGGWVAIDAGWVRVERID
ncbi:MAG: hypothetical protein AAGA56_28760, partial [Myxococcota bacterium]